MKYSMFPPQCKLQRGSRTDATTNEIVNHLEVEQIYSCVNKFDLDTAYRKQDKFDKTWDKMTGFSVHPQKLWSDSWMVHPPKRWRKIGKLVEMTENEYD